MQWTLKRSVVAAAMVTSLLGATLASAQIMGLAGPLSVRFVGTFEPFDEKKEGDINTLTVFVEDQKWLFHVTRVDTTTGTDPGMMLLSHLFPPFCHRGYDFVMFQRELQTHVQSTWSPRL